MRGAKEALLNFPRLLLTNLGTIVFALVLALIVWFAISFQLFPDVTRTIHDVPITAEVTDYMRDLKLVLSAEFEDTINVEITGKRYEIGGVSPDDFIAKLDFSEVRDVGVHTVPVLVQPRVLADDFTVMPHNMTVNVTVIQTAEKRLTIIPDLEGLIPAEGMMINRDNVVVLPDRFITIHGERSLIDTVDSVHLLVASAHEQPIEQTSDLPGELAFFDRDGLPIDAVGIDYEERAFTVTVPIFMHRTLPLGVEIINAPDNFDLNSLLSKMTFNPQRLPIAAPDSTIDSLDRMTLGTISLSGITLEDLEQGRVLGVTLPPGYVNDSDYDSVELKFNCDDYEVRQFNVPSDNISVINAPNGFTITVRRNQRIPVTVIGPADVLETLTVADIRGTINYAGILDVSPGTKIIGGMFTIDGANVSAWVTGTSYEVEVVIR
ncbi:MAG: hypothetical protein FWG45_06840 [Oscillospiraceae bacterium]|nr:hypothetical protein [Oscillospiraceae bacterium]